MLTSIITARLFEHGESQLLSAHCYKTPGLNNVITKQMTFLLQWKKQRPRKSCQFAVITATSTATQLVGIFLAVPRPKNFQASPGFHIPRDAVFSGTFDR
jgi:hypothetical protein